MASRYFAFVPRVARWLFWPTLAFACVMAMLPKPPKLPTGAWGDKWEHALAFFVLAALAQAGWGARRRWPNAAWLIALGALIEIAQLTPGLGRDADLRDWLVDAAVVLLATVLALSADRVGRSMFGR